MWNLDLTWYLLFCLATLNFGIYYWLFKKLPNYLSDCIFLHSHEQERRGSFASWPCEHLVWSVSLILAILVNMPWYFNVVLICISIMSNDIECIFSMLTRHPVTSLRRRLFHWVCFSLFFCIEFLVFYYWVAKALYISYIQVLCHIHFCFADIFSHFVACFFICVTVSFKEQEFLILIKSNLLIFSFTICDFLCPTHTQKVFAIFRNTSILFQMLYNFSLDI